MTSRLLLCLAVYAEGCTRPPDPPPEPTAGMAAPAEKGPASRPAAEVQPSSTAFTSGEFIADPLTATDLIQDYNIGPQHEPTPVGNVDYVESEPGPPEVVGCSDGQREAFADVQRYPTIAGCVGSWGRDNLRSDRLGQPCGDDLPSARRSGCSSPANICATGWHICGNVKESDPIVEDYRDLADRITADDCDNAGPGRFNAAMGHADNEAIDSCGNMEGADALHHFLGCMNYGWGTEPVCCGSMCEFGECKDGVWRGRTRISRGVAQGCGEVDSDTTPGILCCKGFTNARE